MTGAVAGVTRDRNEYWLQRLERYRKKLVAPEVSATGLLTRIVGLTLEAVGCSASMGSRCLISSRHGGDVEAEVVGFSDGKTFLMPVGDMQGLAPGAGVVVSQRLYALPVGSGLLGRVVDGKGEPLDDKGPLQTEGLRPITGVPVNPLSRQEIRTPIDVGVRAINGLISAGRGQRLGLFAGSGVGKSVLLGMMTRFTDADVIVVGLIGERGREVREFTKDILGEQGLAKAVVVAAPADSSPLQRLHGAMYATTIAEYFRDQGKHVLLLIDSLTRFAHAQREIALAIGEPPATRGYPPSVFTKLPQLLERAGNGVDGGGSITAFYTVLVEGEDMNDPVADTARASLDGHVVLSRSLAEAGHFPAIDVQSSVSRLMTVVASSQHLALARRLRQFYATYQESKDLISLGMYQQGVDQAIDTAIAHQPRISSYLQQDMAQAITFEDSVSQLEAIVGESKELELIQEGSRQ